MTDVERTAIADHSCAQRRLAHLQEMQPRPQHLRALLLGDVSAAKLARNKRRIERATAAERVAKAALDGVLASATV